MRSTLRPERRPTAALDFPFDAPATGGWAEVAPGVLWLRLPAWMRPDHVNVYALDDGAAGWTLVDAGLDSPASREAWAGLLAGPLGGRPVWRVIVTHHHPDHMGGAGRFQTEFGAELWATRTAWLLARMLSLDVQERPRPETVAFWRAAGLPAAALAARAAARPFNFADFAAEMPLGFRAIDEGEEIAAGGRLWRVALGGGHAPDHATLWSDDLVLAGDQILPGISPNLGVQATEPEADPVGAWLASCRRLAARAGTQLALPGHGRPFRGVGARLAALEADALATQGRLLAELERSPRTAFGCFPALYGRAIGETETLLALGEAVGHLNHLRGAGAAARLPGPEGAWLWRRR